MAELAMLADDSGRLNHKVVTRPASSLVQDRKSSPAETSVLQRRYTTFSIRQGVCSSATIRITFTNSAVPNIYLYT